MAKSKYSPALFEVINRQRNTSKLSVPKWWKGLGRGGTGDKPVDDPQTSDISDVKADSAHSDAGGSAVSPPPQLPSIRLVGAEPAPASAATESARENSQPATPEPPGSSPRRRIFQIDAGRVWISLNTRQAAYIGGALVLGLIVSFGLGYALSGPEKQSSAAKTGEFDHMLAGKPNPSALEAPDAAKPPPARPSVPAESASANKVEAEPPSPADELKVGLCYVLMDTYKREDRPTAEHVQQWLAEKHNIPTILHRAKDRYRLFSKAGFDWSVPAEREKCQRLAEQVKNLGKDCRKELIDARLSVYGFAQPQPYTIRP